MNDSDFQGNRILVAYGSTDGHTAKIADFVEQAARNHGFEVDKFECESVPDDLPIERYRAAIVAGSLHFGQHQASLKTFVKERAADLNLIPSAFVSVSGTAAGSKPETQAVAKGCADEFTEQTEWTPTRILCIGGALLYRKYGFFMRIAMRRISAKEGLPTDTSKDHDLTDWQKLGSFLDAFLAEEACECEPVKASSLSG